MVENFKPGVMSSMGLGYDEIRGECPHLVYASISGFGERGPLRDLPGFDQVAQGYSGLMSVTGTEEGGPVRVGVAIGDLTTGMWTAIGVLAALRARDQTGQGRRVELSLLGSLVGLLSVQGQRYLSLKELPGRSGNDHPVIAPYGVFQAKDGAFSIAPATPEMWTSLCAILGLEALTTDPRFIDNANRARNRVALKALIDSRLGSETRATWTAPASQGGDRLRSHQLDCRSARGQPRPAIGADRIHPAPEVGAARTTRQSHSLQCAARRKHPAAAALAG